MQRVVISLQGSAWVKSVADDPVAISYKTQSLAVFVSEPLKSVLTKALDDFESGENGAFSTAQKEAASLQSQFIAMPRQFSGDNDGQKCYTGEKGGAGFGSFSCPQRHQNRVCPAIYRELDHLQHYCSFCSFYYCFHNLHSSNFHPDDFPKY